MTDEEILSRLHKLKPKDFLWSKDMIYWKKKTFDFITAANFASEVGQLSDQVDKKIDAWSVFAISGLGINIDDLFQMSFNGENKIDAIKLISDTTNYINQYKELKVVKSIVI